MRPVGGNVGVDLEHENARRVLFVGHGIQRQDAGLQPNGGFDSSLSDGTGFPKGAGIQGLNGAHVTIERAYIRRLRGDGYVGDTGTHGTVNDLFVGLSGGPGLQVTSGVLALASLKADTRSWIALDGFFCSRREVG